MPINFDDMVLYSAAYVSGLVIERDAAVARAEAAEATLARVLRLVGDRMPLSSALRADLESALAGPAKGEVK